MNAYYLIMLYDPSRPQRPDRPVDRRVLRGAAERVCRELNRQSVERHGPGGPLYYLERTDYREERL